MSSGYGETSPRESIKKNLQESIGVVYSTPGTLDSKNTILQRVSTFLRQIYNKGVITDYTYSVESHSKDEDVTSIIKGGSLTYWINFSFKLPYQDNYIEETITVYVSGVRDYSNYVRPPLNQVITSPYAKSINSDGSVNKQDFTGVESNLTKTNSKDFV